MKAWNICGHQIAPGEKKQITLEPLAGYQIPATALCGTADGMTVTVTGGVHSGEYPGIAATIRTAAQLDPALIKGRILLVHCVNVSGFWAKSPSRVPEDGANLNANYPGDANGGVGDRIADFFVRKVFPQTDFLLDLHSGSPMEPLTPCLFFPAAAGDKVRKIAEEAARATDIPYLIASTTTTGEYSYAAANGIPGILLERGCCGSCREDWVRAYHRDIRLILNHFGHYPMDGDTSVCAKTLYNKTVYLTADKKGLWYPQVAEGAQIKQGALLGSLEDFYGNLIREYRAEGDATVFYYSSCLAVNPGNSLVAYGLEEFAQR